MKPPRQWWEIWRSFISSEITPRLPFKQRPPSDHQLFLGLLNVERTHFLYRGEPHKINTRLRAAPFVDKQTSESPFTVPCDVISKNRQNYVIRPFQECIFLPNMRSPQTHTDPLNQYLQSLPSSASDIEHLCDLANDGELHAASDGSAKNGNKSTFSVCLSSSDMTTFHISAHEARGLPHDSGRAELHGLLIIVAYLSKTLRLSSAQEVPVYCDNLESLNFAKDPFLGTTPKWADTRNADLKRRLQSELAKTSIKFAFTHVKAHQDDTLTYEDLTLPAKLNYHCDLSARNLLHDLSSSPTRAPPDKDVPHAFDSQGRITSPITDELTIKRYRPLIALHLHLPLLNFDDIDWASHSKALRKLHSPALKKIIWGQNPSRQRLHQMKKHPSPLCPLCDEVDTPGHFLCCQPLNSHSLFTSEFQAFQSRATKAQIPDHIINTISHMIQGFELSANRQPPSRRATYQRQAAIGWSNFARGRITKDWIQQKPVSAASTNDDKWMLALNSAVLESLRMKWEVRCRIATESLTTCEHTRLHQEALALWQRRSTHNFLSQDSYLMNDKFSPDKKWGIDTLRNWIMTRKLAITAAQEVALARNNTLDSWILTTQPDNA